MDNCKSVSELGDHLQVTHVQYNNDDEFDWLTDYLCDYTFDNYEKDKFTYYKIDNRLTEQEFRGYLLTEINEKKDEEKPELEFRGYPLKEIIEREEKLFFTDLFYSRSICLIVRNEKDQPFTLKPVSLDLQPEPELCEYCDERQLLTIACHCKQAFYCSIRCRVKNMNYHRKHCPYSLDIEPLLETVPAYEKSDELNYNLGLINMGNSCYLSSVMQVLRLYPDFYEQIKSLDHAAMIELNKKKLNIYPYMEDAFNRMNFSDLKDYAPYLLKAVIGIKNSSVESSLTKV